MSFWKHTIEARTQASHLPLSFFHFILACNQGPTQRLHLDPSSLFFSLNDISLFFYNWSSCQDFQICSWCLKNVLKKKEKNGLAVPHGKKKLELNNVGSCGWVWSSQVLAALDGPCLQSCSLPRLWLPLARLYTASYLLSAFETPDPSIPAVPPVWVRSVTHKVLAGKDLSRMTIFSFSGHLLQAWSRGSQTKPSAESPGGCFNTWVAGTQPRCFWFTRSGVEIGHWCS